MTAIAEAKAEIEIRTAKRFAREQGSATTGEAIPSEKVHKQAIAVESTSTGTYSRVSAVFAPKRRLAGLSTH